MVYKTCIVLLEPFFKFFNPCIEHPRRRPGAPLLEEEAAKWDEDASAVGAPMVRFGGSKQSAWCAPPAPPARRVLVSVQVILCFGLQVFLVFVFGYGVLPRAVPGGAGVGRASKLIRATMRKVDTA